MVYHNEKGNMVFKEKNKNVFQTDKRGTKGEEKRNSPKMLNSKTEIQS